MSVLDERTVRIESEFHAVAGVLIADGLVLTVRTALEDRSTGLVVRLGDRRCHVPARAQWTGDGLALLPVPDLVGPASALRWGAAAGWPVAEDAPAPGTPVVVWELLVGLATGDTGDPLAVAAVSEAADARRLVEEATGRRMHLEPSSLAGVLRPWWPRREPRMPDDLWRPEYEQEPFAGRIDEIARMTRWCAAPAMASALLVTGPGGAGKSRLARRVAELMHEDGWAVGDLASDRADAVLNAVAATRRPALLVVDAAASRVELIGRLAQAWADRLPAYPVRLLLVDRYIGAWWPTLVGASRSAAPMYVAEPLVIEPTGPLQSTVDDQVSGVFRREATRLTDRAYAGWEQALTMAMLVSPCGQGQAVDALAQVRGLDGPAADGIRNELAGWIRDLGLSGSTEWFWDALGTEALVAAWLGNHAGSAVLDGIAALPAPMVQRALVRLACAAGAVTRPGLLDRLVDLIVSHPDRVGVAAVRAAASGQPPVLALLQQFLARRHGRADTGHLDSPGGATVFEGTTAPISDGAEVLSAVGIVAMLAAAPEPAGPLLEFCLSLCQTALAGSLDRGTSVAVQHRYAAALAEAGRLDDALAVQRSAVVLGAAGGGAWPVVTNQRYATLLLRSGQRNEAARAASEATSQCRRLVRDNSRRHEPRLADCLLLLARCTEGVDEDVANVSAQEAVRRYDSLAARHPVQFRARLSDALGFLAVVQSRAGRSTTALATRGRRIDVLRDLAQAHPDTHLSELGHALGVQADAHAALGDQPEAARAAAEQVAVYRRLAQHHPEVFQPALSAAEAAASTHFAEAGLAEQALAAAADAVRHADAEPALAAALQRVSVRLGEAGQWHAAVEAGVTSVNLYKRLAGDPPTRHRVELAAAEANLAAALSATGRSAESTAAAERVAALVGTEPSDDEAALLVAIYHNMSTVDSAGQHGRRIDWARGAVSVLRDLAGTRPAMNIPLADALLTLAEQCAGVDPQAALTAAKEAAEIRMRLQAAGRSTAGGRTVGTATADGAMAATALALEQVARCQIRLGMWAAAADTAEQAVTSLDYGRPDTPVKRAAVAAARLTQARALAGLGRPDRAGPAVEEAVARYDGLASQDPLAYLAMLADALRTRLDLPDPDPVRALATAHKYVAARRGLCGADPAGQIPLLVDALHRLSEQLNAAGRTADALAAGGEAVSLARRLAARPGVEQRAVLAGALRRLATLQYGPAPDASATSAQEAIELYRALTDEVPELFAEPLVEALHFQARLCEEVGRPADMVRYAEEAVDLARALADPVARTRLLPSTQVTLCLGLLATDRRTEAVEVYREVVETPDLPDVERAFLDDAMARVRMWRLRVERRTAADRAVAAFGRLHAADPQRYRDDYLVALRRLVTLQPRAGRAATRAMIKAVERG